jgi:hypothetical protein
VEEEQLKKDDPSINSDAPSTSTTEKLDSAFPQRMREDMIATPVHPRLPMQTMEPLSALWMLPRLSPKTDSVQG